ncbi:AAA domain-containing protein [Tamaricihabitans halophyticus]|uniref:AAA domain-containing protein n=1 Tax=Tamaricihabitans halophyticus TaxID=1262583 RepID=A0A4R2R4Z0_9PSEU|nr:NERD domain-containing protein [Tamaricihabitans halophyticus]TCP57087.1 AAA domain-containing protein [Tamaricihabitans halophyticus]
MSALPAAPDAEGLSPAEHAVFTALREQLPESASLVTNLVLTRVDKDREADAVVVWPGVGVAIIEVKGGQIDYANGRWVNVIGKKRKPISNPARQAREFKYGLRGTLRTLPRWSGGDPRLAHHVAVPFTTLRDDFGTTECPRYLISDQRDLARLGERIRDQLLALRDQPAPPTEAEAAQLVDVLRGPHQPQIDLAGQLAANDAQRSEQCRLYTLQQGRMLEMLREQPRVQVMGGAGTGKTFLAVAQASRFAQQGKRVALLCFNRGLAELLRREVAALPQGHRPARVGTFHSFAYWLGGRPAGGHEPGPEFYEREAARLMATGAAELSNRDRFDALVIDEVQDFAPTWWEPLHALLRNPDRGSVIAFADEGQRVFDRGAIPEEGFLTLRLDENVRNSKQIARAFQPYGAQPVTPRGVDGPEVRFVRCAVREAVPTADRMLAELLREGWKPADVLVLTTRAAHPQQARRIAELGKNGYRDSFWDGSSTFYGHVKSVKGLERKAVVLALNGFPDSAQERQLRYVGMSRATDLLVVCGPG